MAGGWSHDGAVQEQIDASTEDEVKRVRSKLSVGESLAYCEECGESIPEARRKAIAGVRLCVSCQAEQDKQNSEKGGFNRRASKDSQLR
ncbi:DksA/TraR family C4-type zinc finger protein [Idiomarina aminovorans]|uniref:DksA/TraR family C4-type zinc finger protein n=1 Tax=Idiomarina aminovorans TaxID=2914829 RepID=UPI0020032665|nr:DksA/TraR family C4-type zinc finger protein [Idiomarina sp. ATCH4]MCK7458736.1 DksA/TraR family C4-type zinc finger protein [Idiomarina sp. ATCH4]